jgi:hypothetical protein
MAIDLVDNPGDRIDNTVNLVIFWKTFKVYAIGF